MRTRGVLLASAVSLSVVTGALWGALADDSAKGEEQLTPIKQLGVGSGKQLGAFDISFVDPKIELYVLADRTNASVDLFDSEEPRFIGRVGTTCPTGNPAPHFCFAGVVLVNKVANNNLSGPDGVVVVDHKEVWAGDGDSRVKVIDLATKTFVTTIDTGGQFRVDEMAYDSRDHILAAANNADDPPFITLFNTNKKTILGKITFDGTNNTPPASKTGIEQPQWSPATGLFYVSVPDFTTEGADTVGGVSVIDPGSMKVLRTLKVKNCNPAGLALGPRHEALIGCALQAGTAPNQTTQSLIIDITNTGTKADDAVVARVPIGGSDEVWFDRGTRHYFLAARNNLRAGKADPILGSIDAGTNKLDPSAPTSTTAHSVAADQNSHFIFVPIGFVPPGSPPGTDPTNPCPVNGCIAVFRAHSEGGDDQVAQREGDRFADHE
jgi:hypothetical protein